MTFMTCIEECLNNAEFVLEYNRLNGTSIGKKDQRTPIERLVDETTGYKPDDKEMLAFIAFVDEYVWAPILAQVLGLRRAPA